MKVIDGYNIREATLDDVINIAELKIRNYQIDYHSYDVDLLLKDLFLNIYKKRWVNYLIQGMKTLILTENNELIGFISYTSCSTSTIEINNIYLIPEVRGKKWGKYLCDSALKKMKEDHFKQVIVWIVEGSDVTKQFYKTMGFQATTESRTDQLKEGLELFENKYYLQLS